MMTWSLWEARNDMLLKGTCWRAFDVICRATTLLGDFKNAKLEKDIPMREKRSKLHWVAPDARSVKVNFDAVIFKDIGGIGIGVAIRDSGALHNAMNFSLEVGIRNIEAEGDSMVTIGAVNSSSTNNSITGWIVESIKVLAQSFHLFKLNHVRRNGNVVAHSLAKHAKEVDDYEAWMEDTPSFLHELVLN
ncbi:hypothetical protein REPUB_Repub08aG0187200 [Reevesia pubescens]